MTGDDMEPQTFSELAQREFHSLLQLSDSDFQKFECSTYAYLSMINGEEAIPHMPSKALKKKAIEICREKMLSIYNKLYEEANNKQVVVPGSTTTQPAAATTAPPRSTATTVSACSVGTTQPPTGGDGDSIGTIPGAGASSSGNLGLSTVDTAQDGTVCAAEHLMQLVKNANDRTNPIEINAWIKVAKEAGVSDDSAAMKTANKAFKNAQTRVRFQRRLQSSLNHQTVETDDSKARSKRKRIEREKRSNQNHQSGPIRSLHLGTNEHLSGTSEDENKLKRTKVDC